MGVAWEDQGDPKAVLAKMVEEQDFGERPVACYCAALKRALLYDLGGLGARIEVGATHAGENGVNVNVNIYVPSQANSERHRRRK